MTLAGKGKAGCGPPGTACVRDFGPGVVLPTPGPGLRHCLPGSARHMTPSDQQLFHHAGDEAGQVVLWQPFLLRCCQRQLLVRIVRQISLAHHRPSNPLEKPFQSPIGSRLNLTLSPMECPMPTVLKPRPQYSGGHLGVAVPDLDSLPNHHPSTQFNTSNPRDFQHGQQPGSGQPSSAGMNVTSGLHLSNSPLIYRPMIVFRCCPACTALLL